jgi:hypothetical protein
MWTINDLSVYADLSNWPNRGVKACSCCMHSTCSKYLKNEKEILLYGAQEMLAN